MQHKTRNRLKYTDKKSHFESSAFLLHKTHAEKYYTYSDITWLLFNTVPRVSTTHEHPVLLTVNKSLTCPAGVFLPPTAPEKQ